MPNPAAAYAQLPCSQCGHHRSNSPISVVSLLQNDQTFDIVQLQFDDTTIGPFLRAKLSNSMPPLNNNKDSRDTNTLRELWNQLEVHDGIFW